MIIRAAKTALCTVIVALLFWTYGNILQEGQKKPMTAVLMFHSVNIDGPQNPSEKGVIIAKHEFEQIIKYFKSNNYMFIDSRELKNVLEYQTSRTKTILLTFDDGYEDNYTNVFPLLKKYDVKALINIIVKKIDSQSEVFPKYLSWSQINTMLASGLVEIGAHSYNTHNYAKGIKGKSIPEMSGRLIINGRLETDEEYEGRIKADIEKADNLILKNTSRKPSVIAYPYGVSSPQLRMIAKNIGYDIQLGIKQGCNYSKKDLENIKRITVRAGSSPSAIERKIKFFRGLQSILFG